MTARVALGAAIGVLLIASTAWGEPAAAPPAQSDAKPGSGAGAPTEPKEAAGTGKRKACQQDASAKKLRGLDRVDSIQICMAEARLDCTKQAVAQKVAVADRRNFLKTCMGGVE